MGGLVATTMLGSACSGPTHNVDASEKRYELAADMLKRGELDDAQMQALKALQDDPQDANAAELIGDIYLYRALAKTQFAQVEQCAQGQEAADYDADRDQALRDAETWFRKATALKADDARAMDNLGVAALNLEDWDTVVQADGDAIQIEDFPSRFMAEGDLGWAYFKKGDDLHALEKLKEAVAQAPQYCVGRYRLAEVYFAMGQLDQAEQAAGAIDQEIKECPIQENERLLGLIRVKRNDLPGAERYFEKCLSLSPRSCVANDCRQYLQQVAE